MRIPVIPFVKCPFCVTSLHAAIQLKGDTLRGYMCIHAHEPLCVMTEYQYEVDVFAERSLQPKN